MRDLLQQGLVRLPCCNERKSLIICRRVLKQRNDKSGYIVLLTGLAFTVEARIGDTKDQAAARYGKPLKCEQEDGVEGCSYNSGRFFVKCWYLAGVVGALMVKTLDDTPFSQDEIDVIRNANSGGSSWKEKPAELSQMREYERADGKAWITIIKGNYLFTESVQFRAAKEGMSKF